MPRPLRIHVDGALHFITSRSVAPLVLFRDAKDYAAYLELLNEYRLKYGFTLFGFVLFPDHLHLCLEPTNTTTVSAIMHAITSRYTKYFNRRHHHAGHLFQERFKSTLIEKAPSLLRLTAYLHLYPLRMGAVNDLSEYHWTSLPDYLAMQDRAASREAQELFDRLVQEYPGLTYEQYVMSMTEPEWQQLHEELQQRVVGSPSFMALVEQRLKAPSKPVADEPRPIPHQPRTTQGGQVQPRPVVAAAPKVTRRVPARAFERQSAMILNGTFALAFVSLCAAALYARNLDTLRQTVQALVHERMAALNLGMGSPDAPSARLASFNGLLPLDGTAVNIEIRAITSTSRAGQKDRLEFRRDQMTSQLLGAAGFLPSKYTASHRNDGTMAWETIQVDRAGAMVHWQGEWDGQAIRGIVTRQAPGSAPVNFSFVGIADGSGEANHGRREI